MKRLLIIGAVMALLLAACAPAGEAPSPSRSAAMSRPLSVLIQYRSRAPSSPCTSTKTLGKVPLSS